MKAYISCFKTLEAYVCLHFSLLILKVRNEGLQIVLLRLKVSYVNIHFFFLLLKVRNVSLHKDF